MGRIERLRALDIDGIIVYDIQDEAERTATPRPFPFLTMLAPADYADVHLGGLALPKVVYRSPDLQSTSAELSDTRVKRPAATSYVMRTQ